MRLKGKAGIYCSKDPCRYLHVKLPIIGRVGLIYLRLGEQSPSLDQWPSFVDSCPIIRWFLVGCITRWCAGVCMSGNGSKRTGVIAKATSMIILKAMACLRLLASAESSLLLSVADVLSDFLELSRTRRHSMTMSMAQPRGRGTPQRHEHVQHPTICATLSKHLIDSRSSNCSFGFQTRLW